MVLIFVPHILSPLFSFFLKSPSQEKDFIRLHKAFALTGDFHSCSKAVPFDRYCTAHAKLACIHKRIFHSLFVRFIIQMIRKHKQRHALRNNKSNAVSVRRKEIYLFSHSQHSSRRERHQGTIKKYAFQEPNYEKIDFFFLLFIFKLFSFLYIKKPRQISSGCAV